MSKAWKHGSDARWRNFRAFILARDKYLCTIGDKGCLGVAPLIGGQVDHIIPRHLGGAKYDPANCRAACQPCNRGRKYEQKLQEPEPRRVSDWGI